VKQKVYVVSVEHNNLSNNSAENWGVIQRGVFVMLKLKYFHQMCFYIFSDAID